MDVMEAIKTRWSVRQYADKQVEQEKLAKIMEAGRLAPSASNEQKWKLIAVTDPELRKKMVVACMGQKFVGEAPVDLVVCATGLRNMFCGQPVRTVDCSIALSYMTLEAVELGLGFCWLGLFDQNQVRKILNIPEEYEVVAIAPIGYAAKEGRPSPKKSAEEVIVYNQM